MRGVLAALVIGCGSSGDEGEGPPIGEVMVTVYTNASGGSHQFSGRPVADAYVFTTGTLVRSDADGNALLPVSRESSTIHVLIDMEYYKGLYTLTEVPVGATILVGDRAPTETAGGFSFSLPTITGAMYWVATPSCLYASSTSPQASPNFFMSYRATCAGRRLRVYGFAREASGAEHVSEISAMLQVSTAPTVGPYTDPVAFTIDVTNLPDTISQLELTPGYMPSESSQFVAAGASATVSVAGSAASVTGSSASGANAFTMNSDTPTARSFMLARHDFATYGFGPVPMLPAPHSIAIAGTTVSWQFDASGRNVDGFTLAATIRDAAGDTQRTWTVWGGPTTREVTLPTQHPADVPLVLSNASLSLGSMVYFDALGKERPFDIERNGILGPDGVAWTTAQ